MNNYPPGVTGAEPQITGEDPEFDLDGISPEEEDFAGYWCKDCGEYHQQLTLDL